MLKPPQQPSNPDGGTFLSNYENLIMSSKYRNPSRIGQAITPGYSTWRGMVLRCMPDHKNHDRYFDRGITVCSEWSDPDTGWDTFVEWARENGFAPGLDIDRIDNDGNYCPDNCRFVTHKENIRNSTTVTPVVVNGKYYEVLTDAADDLGLTAKTLSALLRGLIHCDTLSPNIRYADEEYDKQFAKARAERKNKRRKVAVDGVIYRSITAAAKVIGITPQGLGKVLAGIRDGSPLVGKVSYVNTQEGAYV